VNGATRFAPAPTVGHRCLVCIQPLYVKLSRDAAGQLRREAYCPACDVSPQVLEVTTPAGRRAAFLRAATRATCEISQGAA
jgi:hypothetical protein